MINGQTGGNHMNNEFVQILLGIAIVAIGAAGAYAITAIASYYKSKREQLLNELQENSIIKYNKAAREALDTVDMIIFNVVSELEDTVKKEILQASSDGKLTDDEKERLKDVAMKTINTEIGEPVKEFAKHLVGNLDNYISTVIENCVTSLKTEDKKDDNKKETDEHGYVINESQPKITITSI